VHLLQDAERVRGRGALKRVWQAWSTPVCGGFVQQ
jgi:hypothetical protein